MNNKLLSWVIGIAIVLAVVLLLVFGMSGGNKDVGTGTNTNNGGNTANNAVPDSAAVNLDSSDAVLNEIDNSINVLD